MFLIPQLGSTVEDMNVYVLFFDILNKELLYYSCSS